MKTGTCKVALVVGVCCSLLGVLPPLSAQESNTASAIVTVISKSAEDGTAVPKQTMSVYENRKLQEVAGWVPLRGERSGLQLVVLLDDSSRGNLGLQLNDIRSFVTGLPPMPRLRLAICAMDHRTWCKTLPTITRKQSRLSACLRGQRVSMEALIFASRLSSSSGREGLATFAAR